MNFLPPLYPPSYPVFPGVKPHAAIGETDSWRFTAFISAIFLRKRVFGGPEKRIRFRSKMLVSPSYFPFHSLRGDIYILACVCGFLFLLLLEIAAFPRSHAPAPRSFRGKSIPSGRGGQNRRLNMHQFFSETRETPCPG